MKRNEFDKIARDVLCPMAFVRKKYNFIKKISEDSIGTIGFGIHSHLGTLFINPVIGVINNYVEELYSKLTGIDTVSIFFPTISTPIGYLMPENIFLEWEYSEQKDITYLNSTLISAIEKFGFPFMEKYKAQDELLTCFKQNKFINNQSKDYRLPILYYIMGEKGKGLDVIKSSLERQKQLFNEESILKFTDLETDITIVGSGYGKADPEYLKFIENFKNL
jgi:hypothetical protein